MDPQATWDQLLCAYREGDWDVIEERALDLLAWLDRGGFPPTILKQPDLDQEWNKALARAGCLFALEIVQGEWNIPTSAPEWEIVMSTQQPLYLRLYSSAAYYELARIIGYAGLSVPDAQKHLMPLADKYGKAKMAGISEELVYIDSSTSPPTARLKPEVRKLCAQLLGLPSEHPWYELMKKPGRLPLPWEKKPPAPPTVDPPGDTTPDDTSIDSAMAKARNCKNRKLLTMLRTARRSLRKYGPDNVLGTDAEKDIAAAEAELKRRGLGIPIARSKRFLAQNSPASDTQLERRPPDVA